VSDMFGSDSERAPQSRTWQLTDDTEAHYAAGYPLQ